MFQAEETTRPPVWWWGGARCVKSRGLSCQRGRDWLGGQQEAKPKEGFAGFWLYPAPRGRPFHSDVEEVYESTKNRVSPLVQKEKSEMRNESPFKKESALIKGKLMKITWT